MQRIPVSQPGLSGTHYLFLFWPSILILQETATPLTETTSILVLVFGTLLFTLFTVSILLYIALRRQRQFRQRLEKREAEHNLSNRLMQIRMEVQEHTLNNMSAEMHENIAQILASVKMQIYALYTHAADAEQRALAEETSIIMRDVIKDVRNMSYAMKDIYLLRNGLKESIEKELGRIVAAHRIKCNFTQTGPEQRLGADRELILFSIIQESVANAVINGQPLTLSVSLQYGPGQLEVLIEDNGTGLDTTRLKTGGGAGIRNIEERIKLLDAAVSITSELNKGTRIRLNIPVITPNE